MAELTVREELAIQNAKDQLSLVENQKLEAMMKCFSDATIETLKEGDSLLPMCKGCAFQKNSAAQQYPHTALTALECVLKEEPFYCHVHKNKQGNEKLCNGWINIMNSK